MEEIFCIEYVGNPEQMDYVDMGDLSCDYPIIAWAEDWVLVKGTLDDATKVRNAMGNGWRMPFYAADGIWVRSAGDAVYIANGEDVSREEHPEVLVARALGWNGEFDPEDIESDEATYYVWQKDRYF